MMEDADFEPLFDEVDHVLQPSLQGPLTTSTDLKHFDSPFQVGASAEWLPMNETLLLPRTYPNAPVIDKIEAVLENIVDSLLNDRSEISIVLKNRRQTYLQQSDQGEPQADSPTIRLSFPGKTADEAWRFSVVLRILELMHEALRNDVVISKRDMFYRDPALFGSQAHVDRYVDDIAFTFGLSRSQLHVVAAAKGLVAGAFIIHRRDGSTTDATSNKDGMLVPGLKDILSIRMSSVRWILVIEKEATFRSIAASNLWDRISAEGIILTGKGYPDLATRALLHFLTTPSISNGFASPTVYGLADFDPDGLAILSTYKHGSKALAHESKDHAVPELRGLGLRSEHIRLAGTDTHAAQGLLTLTKRDRQKALTMLEQLGDEDDEHSAMQRRELQTMLLLNVKAELQLLDVVPNGMTKLLKAELFKNDV